MKIILAILVTLSLAVPCPGADLHTEARVRVALAMASCPRNPQVCPCTGAATCTCDPNRCACPQCLTQPVKQPTWATQEQQWYNEGWRKDSQGQWYRPLRSSEYQAPVQPQVFFYPAPSVPMMTSMSFMGGGCAGGS